MTIWEAVFLGFVQGATEFLPVSSSGHLVIAQTLMGIDMTGVVFEVAVHVATLVSILWVYRERVLALVSGIFAKDGKTYEYVGLLMVATLPAGLAGVFAKDWIEGLFENPMAPGIALLVTGVVLWSSRGPIERAALARPGWTAALAIGVAQAFALVPGISRSGSTVVVALWLGVASGAGDQARLLSWPVVSRPRLPASSPSRHSWPCSARNLSIFSLPIAGSREPGS